MYTEGSLGCGRTVWRSRGAAAAVVPADGCIDVILRGDDVHLAGPSTACIPTSPDVGETIAGIILVPAAVLEVARVLRALRSFGTAPRVDLLTSPADGWAGLVRRAAAARAGAAEVAGEIGWSARHLRRRMLATFGYGYGALVRVARMRRALSLLGPGSGSPAGPAATRWLSRATTKERPEPKPSLAAVAHAAGYADQAHMTRDFRLLVGRTPAQVAGSQA